MTAEGVLEEIFAWLGKTITEKELAEVFNQLNVNYKIIQVGVEFYKILERNIIERS